MSVRRSSGCWRSPFARRRRGATPTSRSSISCSPGARRGGEKILAAAAPPAALSEALASFLATSVESLPRSIEREPEQTMAFRRVLQVAVLHVQSAGRDEVRQGDLLAAIMQQSKTRAAQFLADQGITRLDVLNFISHGITKVPSAPGPRPAGPRRSRGAGGIAWRVRRGRAIRSPPTR